MNLSLCVLFSFFLSTGLILGSVFTDGSEGPVPLESDAEVTILKVVKKVAMRPKPLRQRTPPKPDSIVITLDSDSDEHEEKPEEILMEVETFPMANETDDICNGSSQLPGSLDDLESLQADETTIPAELLPYDVPSTPPAPEFRPTEEGKDFSGVLDHVFQDEEVDGKDKEQTAVPRNLSVSFGADDSMIVEIPKLPRYLGRLPANFSNAREHLENRFDHETFKRVSSAAKELVRPIPDCHAENSTRGLLKRKATCAIGGELALKKAKTCKNEKDRSVALYGAQLEENIQNIVYIHAGQPWDVYGFSTVPNPGRFVLYNLRADIKLPEIVETLSHSEFGLISHAPCAPPLSRQKKELYNKIQLVIDLNGIALPFAFVHLENKMRVLQFMKSCSQTEALRRGLGQDASFDFASLKFDLNECPVKSTEPPQLTDYKAYAKSNKIKEKKHINPSPDSLKPSNKRVVLFNLKSDVTLDDLVHALSHSKLGLVKENDEAQKRALRDQNIQLVIGKYGEPYAYVHLDSPELASKLVTDLLQSLVIQSLGTEVGVDVAVKQFNLNAHRVQISLEKMPWKKDFDRYLSRTFWREKNMPTAYISVNKYSKIATLVFHFERHAERAADHLRRNSVPLI